MTERNSGRKQIGFREFLGILVDEPIAVSAAKMLRETGTSIKKRVINLAKKR